MIGWLIRKLLHLTVLAAHVEGASKPFFGFSVRKVRSSLNAFQNCGVLMTLSGNSTENLWLLSMMRLAGWDSVTVEFNSNCLRF